MTAQGVRLGRVGVAMLALLLIWGSGFLVPDLHLALLYLAPGLLLATALLAGRYPGEQALERIAARRRRPPAAASRSSQRCRRRARLPVAAHGGLLLARALAGRAPPRSWRTAASR